MGKFNGFLDNVAQGMTNPKGNLGDWQHASRLYVNSNQKHAPKYKFLYHVTFYLSEAAKGVIPEVSQYSNVIGMLVKSADLPKFQANVEVKNKYNRKKHVQTKIDYQPINISFHDDNYGATTALMEAYYKYYYADGTYGASSGAYGNRYAGDTTYKGPGVNANKFGLDNNTPAVPFFDRIEIAQMARKSYTKYTLVNPIISSWGHDTVDNSVSDVMTNSMTVEYDSVMYDRGSVVSGPNGDPTGFGREDNYDVTPSPLAITGGSSMDLDGALNAGLDLYEYITQGKHFSNPFEAAIAGVNLFRGIRDAGSEGLRQGGLSLLTGAIGDIAGIDVSGVAKTAFPKSGGDGGAKDVLIAGAALAGLSAISQSTGLAVNPQQQDDARFQNFKKAYLNQQGRGGINGAREAYNSLPDSEKANYD